ncbi:MAG: 30S ribosomal protein S18 [Armatimonadota bacterium]|nr:30S ribosomal protein S18 [Armatimonadota bacterium]MDR7401028.1 30S ribosomal protein S18 [Armatimonadota bacterium]MDR7403236.1 30S ribosomal protein S18 [Armatimonadota bacterium]MDR7436739.1 30S ribosomal protein S18 [Armatimonadota bacterium]MDR7471189.1 30S ribosomal protein S18 [Armatimonadota bacterium]
MAEGKSKSGKKEWRGRRPKRKNCTFCAEKAEAIDYKDVTRLRRFVTERGKVLPRRVSGNCARHQRALALAIKRARELALLPYTSE